MGRPQTHRVQNQRKRQTRRGPGHAAVDRSRKKAAKGKRQLRGDFEGPENAENHDS
jgi:hypothetical protein